MAQFFIDENISHHLARALHHLSQGLGDHEVVPCCDRFPRSTKDAVWLDALGNEEGWIIVTKDKFKKGDPEKFAFEQARLTTFNLHRLWSKKKGWETGLQLIRWWPHICDYAHRSHPGTVYEVPWQVSSGKLSRY